MDDAELGEFLVRQRKLVCATIGPRGLPHVVMLGFVARAPWLWAWSYAKSQKVRNLERDGRATLFLETGDSYADYRGAMVECDVMIHRDVEVVAAVGAALAARYGGDAFADALARQAQKRVALEFIARRFATYDHRKLPSGIY